MARNGTGKVSGCKNIAPLDQHQRQFGLKGLCLTILTISHLKCLQIDNFHFLYCYFCLVPTPNDHNLSMAIGVISDEAACVIMPTFGNVRARGPSWGCGGDVEEGGFTISCAVVWLPISPTL